MTLTDTQKKFLTDNGVRFSKNGATHYFGKGDFLLIVPGAGVKFRRFDLMTLDSSEDGDGEKFVKGFDNLRDAVKALLAAA